MAKTSPVYATPLRAQLEKLAALAPQNLPVLSLYLNLGADQHGRDSHHAFLRKVFEERCKAFRDGSAQRESFDRDAARIGEYLSDEVVRSAESLAIFACAGAKGFFETIQLQAPLDEHWLFVGPVPQLYPLARLIDQFPRYAAVVIDTQRSRIVVFALGAVEERHEVKGVKTRRTSMGGWSQARYQRHAENFHLHHIKEVVETLDRIVTAEHIPHILVAGDDVVVAMLKEHLPQRLLDKLVDAMHAEDLIPEDELLRATLASLHEKDAESDAQRARDLVDAWQGSGLGVVGAEATLKALGMGQVDELMITGMPDALEPVLSFPPDSPEGDVTLDTSAPSGSSNGDRLKLAGDLVNRAHQTGARVRFIEDRELLSDFGGVGAFLRYRL